MILGIMKRTFTLLVILSLIIGVVTPIMLLDRMMDVTPVQAIVTDTIYSNATYDADWEDLDAVYNTAWEGNGDGFSAGSQYMITNQANSAGNYYVRRAAFYFDTSSIPDDANISAVRIYIKLYRKYTVGGDYNVSLYGATVSTPPILSDFNQTNWNTLDLRSNGVDTSTWANGTVKVFTLNAAGISGIDVAGWSILGIRGSFEVVKIAPGVGDNDNLWVYSGNAGAGDRPYMEIDYLTKPTVTSSAATNISENAMDAGGSITDTGGENAGGRGVVYDTSTHGDPGDVAPGASGYAWSDYEVGSFGTGAFSRSLSGLSSGETYYYRAFANNSIGYKYATELSRQTAPDIVTDNATGISDVSTILNGNLTTADPVSTRGFEWGTSGAYGTSWNETGSFTTGTFSYNATSLNPNDLYYFRAMGKSADSEWSYGGQLTFYTDSTISTLAAIPLGYTNATLRGNMTVTDAATNRGFIWDDTPVADPGNVSPGNVSGMYGYYEEGAGSYSSGIFSYNATSLATGGGYYYRGAVEGHNGWVYGGSLYFLTYPEVTTVSATNTTINSTYLRLTLDAAVNCNQLGWEYGNVSGGPYPNDLWHTGSPNTTGAYSRQLSGLNPGQGYYFRSKAYNSAGWDYGAEDFVYTVLDPPVLLLAVQYNGTRIDLSWSVGSSVDLAVIRYKTSGFPTSETDGTLVYNGTGTSYNHIGLTNATTYYYRAWGFYLAFGNYSSEYGEDLADTYGAPEIMTLAASSLSITTANQNSYVTGDGDINCTTRFQWNSSPLYGSSNISSFASMEFEELDANKSSVCQVSSNVYAIAYTGPGSGGWIATVKSDEHGNLAGTNHQFITNFEFSSDIVYWPSIVKYPGTNVYVVFYYSDVAGTVYGYVSSVGISSDGATLSLIDTKQFVSGSGLGHSYPLNALHRNGDAFIVAYSGPSNYGYLATVGVNSDGSMSANPNIDSWAYEASATTASDIVRVYGSYYAVSFSNSTATTVFTTEISSAGGLESSREDSLRLNTYSTSLGMSICFVGNYTYVVGTRDSAVSGILYSVKIENDATIASAVSDSVSLANGTRAWIRCVDFQDGVAVVGTDGSGDGWFAVYPVGLDGNINSATSTLEFDNSDALYPYLLQTHSYVCLVAYQGVNGDGWTKAVKVDYDTWSNSSAFDSPYDIGDFYTLIATSLSSNTSYYCRPQIYNLYTGSGNLTSGDIVQYRTLDSIDKPDSFQAIAFSGDSISLSWVRGSGAYYTVVRYAIGAYPADQYSGYLAYNGSLNGYMLTNEVATPVLQGNVYYFRAWSWAPGSSYWSVDYAEDIVTTPAGSVGGYPIPVPSTPDDWAIAASDSPSIGFFDSTIVPAANAIGMPAGTLFLILFIAMSCGVGFFTFLISRSMFLCVAAIACCFGGMTIVGIMPLWIVFAYCMLAGSVWYMTARVI